MVTRINDVLLVERPTGMFTLHVRSYATSSCPTLHIELGKSAQRMSCGIVLEESEAKELRNFLNTYFADQKETT